MKIVAGTVMLVVGIIVGILGILYDDILLKLMGQIWIVGSIIVNTREEK